MARPTLLLLVLATAASSAYASHCASGCIEETCTSTSGYVYPCYCNGICESYSLFDDDYYTLDDDTWKEFEAVWIGFVVFILVVPPAVVWCMCRGKPRNNGMGCLLCLVCGACSACTYCAVTVPEREYYASQTHTTIIQGNPNQPLLVDQNGVPVQGYQPVPAQYQQQGQPGQFQQVPQQYQQVPQGVVVSQAQGPPAAGAYVPPNPKGAVVGQVV